MRSFLFALVFILCVTLPGLAQQPADSPAALTYLSEEFHPYNYTEHRKPKGIAVELLQLMWNEMGMEEQPIQFMPWPRAYQMTIDGPGVVLFATIRSPEREELFKWVGPIATSNTVFIGLKDNPLRMNCLDDAKGLTIGVVRDYASAVMLKDQRNGFKLDEQASQEILINKLRSGRIDLISMEETAFFKTIKQMRLDPEDFRTVWLFSQKQSYYAVSKDVPDEVIEEMQDACDVIRNSSQYQAIVGRHMQ